ncbi:Plac8 family protein, partial [Globisporangium splendens]
MAPTALPSIDKNAANTPAGNNPNAQYVKHTAEAPPNAPPEAAQYIYVVGEPEEPQQPEQPQGPSEWEIGIFECFYAPAHCCTAFFLPCINGAYSADVIGQPWMVAGVFFLVMYLGETNISYYGANGDDFVLFTTSGFMSMVCSLGFIFGVMYLRSLTRKVFNIPGSSLEDFCASFWCSCCTLSQMSAHGERIKHKATGATTLPPYHFS